MVTVPIRSLTSAVFSIPLLSGAVAALAIDSAPSVTRSKKRPMLTGMPVIVSTGFTIMLTVASTGRIAARPAARANSSVLLVSSSCRIAATSAIRILNRSRPWGSNVPTSARMVNSPTRPVVGTSSPTR